MLAAEPAADALQHVRRALAGPGRCSTACTASTAAGARGSQPTPMSRRTEARARGMTATSTGPAPPTGCSSEAARSRAAPCARTSCGRGSRPRPSRHLSEAGADDRDAVELGRRRGHRAREADDRAGAASSRSCTTRPARTRTRVHRRRRSCAGSRSTTCRETAGTTSATTFWSTATARCTRVAAGASTSNVIGAHAEGFNTGTVGVALIGNFSVATPPKAKQDALVEAARVAARRRAHRPARDRRVHVGRQLQVQGGQGRHVARHLGPPRHRAERVPRQRRLRAAAGDHEARCATGLPKIYSPTVVGRARRPDPVPGAPLVRAAWTVTVATSRAVSCARHRRRHDRRLDVGLAVAGKAALHVDDQRAGRTRRDRHDRRRPSRAAGGRSRSRTSRRRRA